MLAVQKTAWRLGTERSGNESYLKIESMFCTFLYLWTTSRSAINILAYGVGGWYKSTTLKVTTTSFHSSLGCAEMVLQIKAVRTVMRFCTCICAVDNLCCWKILTVVSIDFHFLYCTCGILVYWYLYDIFSGSSWWRLDTCRLPSVGVLDRDKVASFSLRSPHPFPAHWFDVQVYEPWRWWKQFRRFFFPVHSEWVALEDSTPQEAPSRQERCSTGETKHDHSFGGNVSSEREEVDCALGDQIEYHQWVFYP